MSIRRTPISLGSKAKGYHNRVMVYAHRRKKARYLAPNKPHSHSPTANKSPEEYGNTWDPRSGIDWYNRMHKRNHYRHWPWARWEDDPVRQHEDPTSRRTFSALCAAANDGLPEFDYYQEVGQDYATPSHFPLTYVAPFIHQYTGKVWSRPKLVGYLEVIQTGTGLRSIEAVAQDLPLLRQWGQEQGGAVPLGVLLHVELVVLDIVRYNQRKHHRKVMHEGGVLRDRDMVRYYALPHLRGVAMPVKLRQPGGAYPWGRYTYIRDSVEVHPLQRPDGRYAHNMYPI